MKRVLPLLLVCLLLAAGCSPSARTESGAPGSAPAGPVSPEKERESPAQSAPAEEEPEPEPTVTAVECTHEGSRAALEIPEGWEYEVEEYSEEQGKFELRFRPEGTTGWVRLACCDWFGVCGTGLEEEEITLRPDLTGTQGTYDGADLWEFLVFSCPEDEEHTYVAFTEDAEDWWPEHGTEAMEILATAQIG